MKVWITKYALTEGIIEMNCKATHDPKMIAGKWNGYYPTYVFTPHWHASKADANARAEQMRRDKLISLEKQIARLKALRFE